MTHPLEVFDEEQAKAIIEKRKLVQQIAIAVLPSLLTQPQNQHKLWRYVCSDAYELAEIMIEEGRNIYEQSLHCLHDWAGMVCDSRRI